MKWQQSGTCVNSVQEYVQNRKSVSPCIRSVKAYQWMSTCSVRCISWWRRKCGSVCASISVSVCGKLVLKRTFRRVLPKAIEDIWVVLPFQKWKPIFWRQAPPRQAFHLPHRGDRGTCARNHSCWPTSDCQRGCRRS